MEHEFVVDGAVVEWRGPAPYHFVVIDDGDDLRERSAGVSYGWGMIPVTCTLGRTTFTTSLWPKDGGYYLPLKDAVRAAERIEPGQHVTVRFSLR